MKPGDRVEALDTDGPSAEGIWLPSTINKVLRQAGDGREGAYRIFFDCGGFLDLPESYVRPMVGSGWSLKDSKIGRRHVRVLSPKPQRCLCHRGRYCNYPRCVEAAP